MYTASLSGDAVAWFDRVLSPEPEPGPSEEPPPAPAGVARLDGATRFATAAVVALDRFDPDQVDVVYLATGVNFPDALTAGPAATTEHAPIVLVATDTVPEVVHGYLSGLPGLRRLVSLGGTVAVSDNIEATLQRILGS